MPKTYISSHKTFDKKHSKYSHHAKAYHFGFIYKKVLSVHTEIVINIIFLT